MIFDSELSENISVTLTFDHMTLKP